MIFHFENIVICTEKKNKKKKKKKHFLFPKNSTHFFLLLDSVYSTAAKNIFLKWVQLAVRHKLTYIKMLVLTSSLRKPMFTSWHFGAGGDILGQKHAFLDQKVRKSGIKLRNSRDPSNGCNCAWIISERVQYKTCNAV